MDPINTRKGKEKNLKKDKSAYIYNNKRVRQYESIQCRKNSSSDNDKNKEYGNKDKDMGKQKK